MNQHIKYSYQFYICPEIKTLQAMQHDGYGYCVIEKICNVTDDELKMDSGRFANWSNVPCAHEVSPKLAMDGNSDTDTLLAAVKSTVAWNSENCSGKWHMQIEDRFDLAMDVSGFFVSFDRKVDADAYQVYYALTGGIYPSEYDI